MRSLLEIFGALNRRAIARKTHPVADSVANFTGDGTN
jgi:hypothetical protein